MMGTKEGTNELGDGTVAASVGAGGEYNELEARQKAKRLWSPVNF